MEKAEFGVCAVFCETEVVAAGAVYMFADEVGGAGPDGAGEVAAGDAGVGGVGEAALAVECVAGINGGGVNFDEDVVGFEGGNGEGSEVDGGGGVVLDELEGFHDGDW